MKRTSKATLALNLMLAGALAWIPACDKAKDGGDRPEAAANQADAKPAAAKPADNAEKPNHAGMDHGEAKPAEAEPSETAEAVADGRVDISVDASGYHPATISAPPKAKITLAFTRTTESGCGAELVLADLDIEKELPLNEVVEVEVEVPETGELGFACGMDMYKGKVVPTAS